MSCVRPVRFWTCFDGLKRSKIVRFTRSSMVFQILTGETSQELRENYMRTRGATGTWWRSKELTEMCLWNHVESCTVALGDTLSLFDTSCSIPAVWLAMCEQNMCTWKILQAAMFSAALLDSSWQGNSDWKEYMNTVWICLNLFQEFLEYKYSVSAVLDSGVQRKCGTEHTLELRSRGLTRHVFSFALCKKDNLAAVAHTETHMYFGDLCKRQEIYQGHVCTKWV